jgi:hypothetical protein
MNFPDFFMRKPVSIRGHDGTPIVNSGALIYEVQNEYVRVEDHGESRIIPWLAIRSITLNSPVPNKKSADGEE